VAVVNFGVEWNRRNRETNRLAEEGNRATEERERANRERNRAAEERERATRRARIQNRWIILQIRHQLQANEQTRRGLIDFLAFLQEYGE
ncbi:MAG: hypothetical protein ACOCZG_01990, partial [Halothece sp.]